MARQNSQKKLFWIILLTVFLFSGGKNTATLASEDSSDLIINEFMAANGAGLTDEDGDYSDWIEIYNRSDLPVNLGGWALTNDPTQPQQWPFPDMNLGSHQYLLVFASGKNRTSTAPGAFLHTNFKLGKSGEFLALHNILAGKFMDALSPQYPAQFRDVSYGRFGKDLSLGYLDVPTPGEPNDEALVSLGSVAPVTFSVERGFYTDPFTVVLATDTPAAAIRYTTDGSEPTANNGAVYTGPIPVQGTTLLRAAAFKADFLPAAAKTQTYIFGDEALAQLSASAAPLPGGSRVLPAAAGDHSLPQPVNKNDLLAGLTSIPAVSLVLDPPGLADFLAQPQARGQDSERRVSFELFFPDRHEAGVQVEAGIRPYGQNSDLAAQQSYRLYFRGKYGSTRLEYPLFSDSPVEAFDTLVLQAAGNDNAVAGAFIGNEWLRESQTAMSGLGAHGMFVNLYLNGQYMGLYNLVERPDADFMAAYIAGQKEDWFVANQAGVLNDELAVPASELIYLYTTLALASSVSSDLARPEYLAKTYEAAASYLDPAYLADYVLLN
ncbi:MAG: chitobiase/beta-hexosaminidase C-terminal domain-containing protein, partial [Chloroflexota bacterium]